MWELREPSYLATCQRKTNKKIEQVLQGTHRLRPSPPTQPAPLNVEQQAVRQLIAGEVHRHIRLDRDASRAIEQGLEQTLSKGLSALAINTSVTYLLLAY